MFAFSKDERFRSPRVTSTIGAYNITGSFGKARDSGENRAFGSSQPDRFGYEELRKHKRGLGGIDGPDKTTMDTFKNRTASFSFGVSRQAMKKIHVDEILKKRDENLPGPDKYGKRDLFGGKQG